MSARRAACTVQFVTPDTPPTPGDAVGGCDQPQPSPATIFAMSATPTTETPASIVTELTSRVEALEAERDQLESRVDEQTDRIDELEATVERLEPRVDHRHEKNLELLNEIVIGDGGYLVDEQDAWLDDHGSILDHLIARADHAAGDTDTIASADILDRINHETAKLHRKLHSVADAAGLSDQATTEDAAHEDKLNRLLRYGPSDVTDTVYAVHNRARDLLEHAGDWGQRASDSLGTRITLTASAVKERLSLKRGESLSSTEVRRVFEKLEALARDSPRKVEAESPRDLPHRRGSRPHYLTRGVRPTGQLRCQPRRLRPQLRRSTRHRTHAIAGARPRRPT